MNGGNKLLKIAGTGPEENSIKNEIKKLGLESKVVLLGWMEPEALIDIYKAAFAFILVSKYEPWGVSVSEAIASNLPLILSNNIGALEEIAFSNDNAIVISDVEGQITDAMSLITNDEKAHSRMRDASIRLSSKVDLNISTQEFKKAVEELSRY